MPTGAFFGLIRRPPVTEKLLTPDEALQSLLASLADVVPDAWLVGGAVRDLASGRTPVDLDIAVPGNANAAAQAIAASLGGTAFALDPERGVARVALTDASTVAYIDVSSFDNGIDADLARRDFTVDAMAAKLVPGGELAPVLDPHGGISDLEHHVVRMVSAAAFEDDPLRLMRGVRLAVELDSEIEDTTFDAMRQHAPLLQNAASERQRDELMRMF